MPMPFFQVTLRTTDVEAARAFYSAVLGDRPLDIVKLHEQAVARGARPHWLGFLDVGDVDRASAAFVERGATPLAPKWVNPEGLEAAVMRDPGGAIVALAKPPPRARASDVVWHLLNTADVQRARVNYKELFGWDFYPEQVLEGVGAFHPFAWTPGAPPVGAMCDLNGRPGVHPHWLFYFPVPAIDRAVNAVRAAGGSVIGPLTLPTGEQLAVCDDAQGAAFGIQQAR